MVGGEPRSVKPETDRPPRLSGLGATGHLPVGPGRVRLSARARACRVTAFSLPVVTAASIVATILVLALAWRFVRRGTPRQRAMTRLLDAADVLEARLRTAKTEIEAITGDEDETVRTALQEMLRQRLWLQQHGQTASIQTLDEIRASIEQARSRIDQQLVLVERARTVPS
jgi:methyl-accepting chemotaxis protein